MYVIANDPLSTTLIVEQAPAQQDDPRNPISGKTGKRLADIMGLGLDEFLHLFNRANLLDRWPGKQGKGDAFPEIEASAAAAKMQRRWFPAYHRVLLLGNNVAKMFNQRHRIKLRWHGNPELQLVSRMAIIPHPSGVNRWWNNSLNREAATKFLMELRNKTYLYEEKYR